MTSVERVSDITRQAKILAKELKVPVLLLAQLNRNLEQRPNKRPIPSDLRESGSIEQDADIIMFVYRDEVYNPHTDDKGVAEIIIGVARDIEACTVRVGYNGKFSKFYDLDSRRAEAPTPMHRPYADRRGMEFD
ncbi:Replicative DNA helicase [compost metagenome]